MLGEVEQLTAVPLPLTGDGHAVTREGLRHPATAHHNLVAAGQGAPWTAGDIVSDAGPQDALSDAGFTEAGHNSP
jgi:hypothetical protein